MTELQTYAGRLTRKARQATLAVLAAGAAWLAVPGTAEARDVYWSVGVGGPGVSVGVGNVPVYQAPVYQAPVYVQPAPVYVQPAPRYRGGHRHHHRPNRGYQSGYARQPVYVAPPVRYVRPGAGYVRSDRHYGHPGHRNGHGRR